MTLKIEKIDENTGKEFFSHLRYLTGLSQEQTAKLLSVVIKTIGNYENGSVSPRLDHVLSLIKELDAEIIIKYENRNG